MMHELLVPAGNMECLRQAVYNGCDAVYLGCKSFGARKFAVNFTNEEIIEAIHFCHLYGVRLYVTMNILVKDNEVDDFINQARFLHEAGVDALIVQDFGMICYLREKFPNLEIHASTQANISTKEVCQLYHSLGVKRVVFARELSIDEIDSIDVEIEKEAFIHGALCISYSGCCLMSSMLGGRSGNRGECAGCCRMPYSLEKNGTTIIDNKYLLSTKELNTSFDFKRLLNSSIYSFKIEGRMKSPLYVGFITRLYRRLIDGEVFDLDSELDKLRTIFNRQFTKGRIFNEIDSNFMNIDSPNHMGLLIGKVLEVKNNKAKIKLFDDKSIHQFDAIRFFHSKEGFIVNYLYDNKMNYINNSNDICYVDVKSSVKNNDLVYKTHDYLLNEEFSNVSKKIPVNFKITASVRAGLFVEINDGENSFSITDKVESANNYPINKGDVERSISKLGNTPFKCDRIDIYLEDNIFIPVKKINQIRRELVDKLIDIRENKKVEFVEKEVKFDRIDKNIKNVLTCLVSNEEQLRTVLALGFSRIYVSDKILYKKYKDDLRICYIQPRCSFTNLDNNNLISDYRFVDKKEVYGDYFLNVYNIYTLYYLRRIGYSGITLSVELNSNELLELLDRFNTTFGYYDIEVLMHGRVEVMIIKGNILNIESNCEYKLLDSRNRRFPVFYDGDKTHILNYEKLDLLNSNISINNCSLRFDFYDENSESIEKIVKNYL